MVPAWASEDVVGGVEFDQFGHDSAYYTPPNQLAARTPQKKRCKTKKARPGQAFRDWRGLGARVSPRAFAGSTHMLCEGVSRCMA